MTIDDDLPPFRVSRVMPEAMKAWAGLLRDPNPIHLDRAAVAAAGLGERRINQGPANLAYVVNAVLAAFPGARLRALDCRFLGNVLEDDAVVAGGRVTGVDASGINCDVWLDVEGGARALAGTARVEFA